VEVDDLAAVLEASLDGAYHIVREIGGGGMSRVFQAEEIAFGRAVVIKVLPPELAAGVSIERFQREIQVAAQLRHPNIVPVFAAGETAGLLFFTMPFIEGESLRDRLRREKRIALRTAIQISRDVADALEYAHRRGILHRDIKPENILLEGSHAVVADFGIARAVHRAVGASTLTQVGMSLGTPHYMSPEQASGEREQDARADIYSLGCMFYEMLTGTPPFSGKSPVAIIVKHLGAPIPTLAEGGVELPPEVDAIIARALAKSPDDRYASSAEFAATLASLAGLEDAAFRTPATGGHPLMTLSSPKRVPIDSLAVLPFSSMSGDADSEYLGDGITESIMNKLSSVAGLRIVPRSVVFRYKGRDMDPSAIAHEVNARAVLTGRLLQRGDTLIVKAELVDSVTDSQLWGEQYNRRISDIFAVQEEMAAEIAKSLRIKLSGEEQAGLAKRFTESTLAYQAYLRGRHHWNKRTVEGLRHALGHFQEAIDLDPNYALAYTGLADTFNILGYYNNQRPHDAFPRGKAAVTRALALDETLSEAHASLGYIQLFYDLDWPGAQRSFQRAIELKPKNATAHQWNAWHLLVTERFDEALVALQRAQELDPLSLIINDHLGYALLLAGKAEEALAQLTRTRELDPGFPWTFWRLGSVYLALGRYDESIDAFNTVVEKTDGGVALGYKGLVCGISGRTDEASAVLARLVALARSRYVSPLEFALVYAGLGRVDDALASLRSAYDDRVSDFVRVKLLPWPDAVRHDARFAELLRQLDVKA